jgi:hypothetical protein
VIALIASFLLAHLPGKHCQGNHGKGDRSGKRSFSVVGSLKGKLAGLNTAGGIAARNKQAAAARKRLLRKPKNVI